MSQIMVQPSAFRCYFCGDTALYRCNWEGAPAEIVPGRAKQKYGAPADPNKVQMCKKPVCEKHVREIGDNVHICKEHWHAERVVTVRSAEYQKYHRTVVDACTELMGEPNRHVFDRETYVEEFAAGTNPAQVARDLLEVCR